MAEPKNILIISFFFPPYKRVGGRRWVKFAKYLVREKHNVKVLCAQLSSSDNSPWDNDFSAHQKNVTRISVKHVVPFFRKNMAPTTITGKIHYRLSFFRYKQKLKRIKGDFNDLSIGYEKQFVEKASELIYSGKVNNIIISGGPFRYIRSVITLKSKYPEANFIIDLRDFWADNLTSLDKERRDFEYQLEKETLLQADKIITPAERIKNHLLEKYPELKNKMLVIPHAFDREDFPLNEIPEINSEELRIIYAGSLYEGLAPEIKTFIQLLNYFKQKGIKAKADIYAFQTDYFNLFEDANLLDIVSYHTPIESKELFKKIKSEYDAVVIFLSGRAMTQHFKSSKYYELAYLKKPIIYVGPKGDVSDYTEKMKLGFFADPNNIERVAEKMIANKKIKEIPDASFNPEDFSFEKVTQELDKILI
jgi:glycosyltransferase involved in cell wall biosynthesis